MTSSQNQEGFQKTEDNSKRVRKGERWIRLSFSNPKISGELCIGKVVHHPGREDQVVEMRWRKTANQKWLTCRVSELFASPGNHRVSSRLSRMGEWRSGKFNSAILCGGSRVNICIVCRRYHCPEVSTKALSISTSPDSTQA